MKKLIYLYLAIFSLSSCFKEEQARPSFTSYVTLELGSDYQNQIFYSLVDTSTVSTNDYLDWNLAFYSGNDGSFIRLNAAANMWVAKTGETNFSNSFSSDINEEDKRFDGSFGLTNNLAIDIELPSYSEDSLFSSQEVYIIHPGVFANGEAIGDYKKFVFEGIYQDSYLIKYANLDGSEEQQVAIPKDANLNYVSFSWVNNTIVTIEPDKTTWDLIFTRSTDTVYTIDGSEFLAGYSVTGAYLNSNSTEAYLIEDIAYEDISFSNIDLSSLSKNENVIGHTWKQFADQYYVFNDKNYIIKDRNGFIYKLRFLSFYDSVTGLKGSPSFEFELIQ